MTSSCQSRGDVCALGTEGLGLKHDLAYTVCLHAEVRWHATLWLYHACVHVCTWQVRAWICMCSYADFVCMQNRCATPLTLSTRLYVRLPMHYTPLRLGIGSTAPLHTRMFQYLLLLSVDSSVANYVVLWLLLSLTHPAKC